jgi:integrase
VSELTYSQLKIVTSTNLKTRSYISFYIKGKRFREFNGNNIGLDIKPNYANSLEDRAKLLRKLHFEIQKAIENNNYPCRKENIEPQLIIDEPKTTKQLLDYALEKKLSSDLSKYYKRNLISIHKKFSSFLSQGELNSPIELLKRARIERFLLMFNTSGTYYMNKRRDLGVLFSSISKDIEQKLMVVLDTNTMKSKATLHKIYSQNQIKPILEYLKVNHPNLHLCCLLSYGCFLRPHQEIRNLYVHHFKKDFTEIHLSGNENKGGKVRVVYIPDYVRKELINRVACLKTDDNIFTRLSHSFNDAYFNTAWTRMWIKMNKIGLINESQTIYSFRHTAAVKVYNKTKDIHILQQLLGHSDMIVTLKYLRGLGEVSDERLKNVMPEL